MYFAHLYVRIVEGLQFLGCTTFAKVTFRQLHFEKPSLTYIVAMKIDHWKSKSLMLLVFKNTRKNTRPLLFTCCSTLPTQILNGSSQEIPRGSISQILFDPALTNTHRFSCRWLDHMATSAAALFGLMWHTVCAHCAVSAQNHVAIFKVHAVWFIWSGQNVLPINFYIYLYKSFNLFTCFFVPYSFLYLASL